MSGDPEQDISLTRHGRRDHYRLEPHPLAIRDRPEFELFVQGSVPDVRQVGRELGVRYVLEGSVRKGGNRVRITGS